LSSNFKYFEERLNNIFMEIKALFGGEASCPTEGV
jgi:hypothetical protein